MFLSIHPYGRGFDYYSAHRSDTVFTYSHYIVDSEFGSEIWDSYTDQWLSQDIVRPGSVIECYESKGEDVAHNLALYHMYMSDTHSWYVLPNEIGYCIKHVFKYDLYVDKVKVHLIKEAYL